MNNRAATSPAETALDQNALRDLQVLEEIENDERISQRGLADRLGIALGLTNSILRRLIRKGLVKTRSLPANRLAYYVTPQGFSEKAKLTIDYIRLTTSFFYRVRTAINQRLERLRDEKGVQTVSVVGVSELAEAVYLSIQEVGLSLSGVFDSRLGGTQWLGHTVKPIQGEAPGDAVILNEPHPLEAGLADFVGDRPVLNIQEILANDLRAFADRMSESH